MKLLEVYGGLNMTSINEIIEEIVRLLRNASFKLESANRDIRSALALSYHPLVRGDYDQTMLQLMSSLCSSLSELCRDTSNKLSLIRK